MIRDLRCCIAITKIIRMKVGHISLIRTSEQTISNIEDPVAFAMGSPSDYAADERW